MIPDWLKSFFGRGAAAIVATFSLWLLSHFGIEMSPDQKASLTEGLTLLGTGVFLLLYAFFHKLFNRWLAPHDTASRIPNPPPIQQ